MDYFEIKNILNRNGKITIGVIGKPLMIKIEEILMKKNYKWRGGQSSIICDYRRDYILININYSGYEPNILSYSSLVSIEEIKNADIFITEKTLLLIKQIIMKQPCYYPRKFIKDDI